MRPEDEAARRAERLAGGNTVIYFRGVEIFVPGGAGVATPGGPGTFP
jgi:hypothetical protein